MLIDNETLFVRHNCHFVLKHAYRHWKQGQLQSNLVWIDSIYINQEDQVEKACQVSFMGDIYAKAKQVLACVGPHADDSEFLVEKALEVANFEYDCDHDDFLCPDCRTPWEQWALKLGIEHLSRLCISCETFGGRVYWTRVWIIQEIAKATSLWVLCGEDMLLWTAFNNLEDFLSMELDEMDSLVSRYNHLPTCEHNQMHDVFRAKKEAIPIEVAFSQFSESRCSNPRDHLYGLLSLIDWPRNMEPIFPDYQASTFNLAVQVEPYLSFEAIPGMLAAFELTSKDEVVRTLIGHKWSKEVLQGSQTVMNAIGDFKPLHRKNEDGDRIRVLCGWLGLEHDGRMTATMVKKDTQVKREQMIRISANSPSEAVQCFDHLPEVTSDSETLARFRSAVTPCLSPRRPELEPQEIMLDSEIAGFVCNDACEGDLLIPLYEFNREVLLVLRQNHGEVFDLIGQGILLSGYDFGCDLGVYDEVSKVPLFMAQVEIKITAKDAILLFAQDMEGSDRGYSQEDRWRRVLTNVSCMPFGAAQITMQTQMLAKDVTAQSEPYDRQTADLLMEHKHTAHSSVAGRSSNWVVGSTSNMSPELYERLRGSGDTNMVSLIVRH